MNRLSKIIEDLDQVNLDIRTWFDLYTEDIEYIYSENPVFLMKFSEIRNKYLIEFKYHPQELRIEYDREISIQIKELLKNNIWQSIDKKIDVLKNDSSLRVAKLDFKHKIIIGILTSFVTILVALISTGKLNFQNQKLVYLKIKKIEVQHETAKKYDVRLLINNNGFNFTYPSKTIWCDTKFDTSDEVFPIIASDKKINLSFEAFSILKDDAVKNYKEKYLIDKFINQEVFSFKFSQLPISTTIRLNPVTSERITKSAEMWFEEFFSGRVQTNRSGKQRLVMLHPNDSLKLLKDVYPGLIVHYEIYKD